MQTSGKTLAAHMEERKSRSLSDQWAKLLDSGMGLRNYAVSGINQGCALGIYSLYFSCSAVCLYPTSKWVVPQNSCAWIWAEQLLKREKLLKRAQLLKS